MSVFFTLLIFFAIFYFAIRYRRRSALRDVAKAYGLPAAEISKLVEALPQRWYGPPPPGYLPRSTRRPPPTVSPTVPTVPPRCRSSVRRCSTPGRHG